ncbi:MAG: diguanylate cyclase [Magnetococcales bacterium]|nr:diguanylate cyclase [Magnetococcales bacterium]MBF0157433.1 diguanylate cyclase [Magnetococcales bacterium]
MAIDLIPKGIFRGVVETVREGVYVTDRDRVISFWNRGAEEITGYDRELVMGQTCHHAILEHIDDRGERLCGDRCPLVLAITQGQFHETEAHIHHRDGHRVPVSIRTAPVRNEAGEIIGACEVFGDISSRIATARRIRELERLAMLDPLTQLANRRYMEASLAQKLEECRQTGLGIGIVFYDIDHFKQVNDAWGHDTGDRVLRLVATTLLKSARTFDILSRWGGEEFLEITPNVDAASFAALVARNRVLVANSEIRINKVALRVTVSLGATLIRADDTLERLLKRADQLLYASKEAGRNRATIG